MVAHAFNPKMHFGGTSRQIGQFKASLVYKTSSRTARTILQRNPVSEIKIDDRYMDDR